MQYNRILELFRLLTPKKPDLEKFASNALATVIELNPSAKDEIFEMESIFMRLKERYKFNKTKLDQLIEDWADYAEVMKENNDVWENRYKADDKEEYDRVIAISEARLEEIIKRLRARV